MPTVVGIWNEALAILGRMPVNNVEATDDVGRMLTDLWTRVPITILEEADWNSAIRRVQLSRLEETPAHGYSFYYRMPNDWIRIVNVNDSGEERDPFEEWTEENEKIATSASAIYLWYVSALSIDTIGNWSQSLADYMSGDMAVRAAPRLAPKLLEHAISERKRRRRLAMSLDAQQNPPRRHMPGSWVRSRLGGIRNATEQGR